MNEPAIRLEEQIISLFPGLETQVCNGWILKKRKEHFWVYPLYRKSSEENIRENIHKCEEIGGQSRKDCVFRIVEHTNYYLSSLLTDTGYVLWKCGIVGEGCPTESESRLGGEKKEPNGGLFLKKGTGAETVEYVMAETDMVIGIKRRDFLFLPDGNLPDNVNLGDILRFSRNNGIKKVLADIPEKADLPEQYKRAGFNRAYLYRCYQKQEEKSAENRRMKNGFAE